MGGLYFAALFLASPYACWLGRDPLPVVMDAGRFSGKAVSGKLSYEADDLVLETDFQGTICLEPFEVFIEAALEEEAMGLSLGLGTVSVGGGRLEANLFGHEAAFELGMDAQAAWASLGDSLVLVDQSIGMPAYGPRKKLVMVYAYELEGPDQSRIRLMLECAGLGKVTGFRLEAPMGQGMLAAAAVLEPL